MARKKWLTTLDEEEVEYIKEIAADADVSGGAVLSELVRKEMKDKNSRLRADLIQSKIRESLEKLNDKQAQLETERAALTKQLKTDKVMVTA